MAVFKRHLTPLTPPHKGGKVIKHVGKGATENTLPGAATGGYSSNLNDYSQATPMANPSPDTPDMS